MIIIIHQLKRLRHRLSHASDLLLTLLDSLWVQLETISHEIRFPQSVCHSGVPSRSVSELLPCLMAEAIGIAASSIAIGQLTTAITISIVKLKSYWDEVQDAPGDVRDLIEELEDLGYLLADIEDDQRQNPVSSLILDPTSTSRCLQHCKRGADYLRELTENLSTDLDASSKTKRKWASAKVVLKKSQIDRYKAKLERAIRLLSLSHQIYTRCV